MVFSMLKFNLVLALLFVNISAYAEDEKFIGCVMERLKVIEEYDWGGKKETHTKHNEPLISIKGGDFEMLIGNETNEEKFPDFIDYFFVGKPKIIEDSNSYNLNYRKYKKRIDEDQDQDQELYYDWDVIINRNNLDMSMTYKVVHKIYGKYIRKDYTCRLIDKVSFEKYKKEMSEIYMKLNSDFSDNRKKIYDARKKKKDEETEKVRKSKI
jgi:hypothetical protein